MQAADAMGSAAPCRRVGIAAMCDLCIGLFGVQVVWGLQNVNTSRIFQTLGADISALPLLWIAAPVTGLLIQPLVGHWSDRQRGRWGRRKPFIAVGALLTAFAMVAMAEVASLAAAVVALWLLTAAVNVAMQPFRALAADVIPPEQRTTGFALQVCFIGAGAVFSSVLPWLLVNGFGIAGIAPPGVLPASVTRSFQLGALVLLGCVGWTLLRSPDRPIASAADARSVQVAESPHGTVRVAGGIGWIAAGLVLAGAAIALGLRRETFLLAAMLLGYGVLRLAVARRHRDGGIVTGTLAIVEDVVTMPAAMRRLAATQFLTWFALFTMWVYSVPAIAARQFGATDAAAPSYAAAGDWVGVLFAAYDAVAVVAALLLPRLVSRLGLRRSHALCLLIGAFGLCGMLVIARPMLLLVPAIGMGIAWASVLATPYIIVANVAPPHKVGVYMGIHNIFLVLPQLAAAAMLGVVLDHLLVGRPDAMLAVAAGALALAAISALALPRTVEAMRNT